MADANMADLLCFTNNGTRPVRATLGATKSIGASFLQTSGLTGWTDESAVHFTMFKVDATKVDAYGNPLKVPGTQSDWKGIVNGSNIEQLQLKAGSDDNYPAGTVVICAATSAWADDLMMGLTVEHDKQGHHKNITALSVTSTGPISGIGLNIPNGPVNLPNGALASLGVAQILARTKLTSNANSIDVFLTNPKRFLRIVTNTRMSGGSQIVEECMRFNDDNANNYTHTYRYLQLAGGGSATPQQGYQTSDNKFDLSYQPTATDFSSTIIDVNNNVANGSKTFRGTGSYGSLSAAGPNVPYEFHGHWSGSPIINKVTLFNTGATGNGYATDSEVIVFGWD